MYLCLIYLIFALLYMNCDGQHKKTCNVFPKDQFIEVGSDAEITCQSACVSGKVFWKLNDKNVNETLSHKINSTHTVLKLPYSELQDPSHPTATVQCHSLENHQILGGTTIRTYTKPHNLSCILHSNKEKIVGLPKFFTCNWEHHMKLPLKINYSVICALCPLGQREICSTYVTNCTKKTDIPSQISYVHSNTIYVRAKTDAWEAYSSIYTFNASDIFRIPPRKVSVSALSDKLLVEWDSLPKTGVNGQCQVEYNYTKFKNAEVIKHMLNTNVTPHEDGKLTIDQVESCTNYSVYVRCALDRAPWSYWSQENTVLTKLKKKDVKLDVWRKVSEIQGKREVHIMWKGIPPNCPGTYSFTIKHTPYNKLTPETAYTETLCGNDSCDITVNQDAYTLNLIVFYNDALLVEHSFHLPADMESDSNRLPGVKDIEIKHENIGLVVHYKAPSQPVSGYMIDWTHDGKKFDWKKVKFTNTTLYGLVDKKPYNITITPLFGGRTGLATQISGICYSFADPGNVTILNVETYDKIAHVSWSIKSQEKCRDVVVNYTVFYGTQNGPTFNLTVNSKIQDIYLTNLNPDTQYSVHVVATAQTGNVKSNERLFKTKKYDPQLITVLSVTGSVVIILILSVGLCCAILWRKFNEKPVPNPGLSSLALWPQTTCQKTMFPFEQFNTPSESLCERVYTEEMQQTSMTSMTIYCNLKYFSDYTDPNAASPQNGDEPSLPIRKPHLSCPRESLLMATENSHFSPYRSQTSAESPAGRTSKKRLSPRQQERERTPAYVSLDMFDQED